MPIARRRGEFRVKLASDKPRMGIRPFPWQLNHLAQIVGRSTTGHDQPFGFKRTQQIVVNLVTVAMPLDNLRFSVNLSRQSAFNEMADLPAQAHGAAEIRVLVALFKFARYILPFSNQGNHREGRNSLKFGAVRTGHTGYVASIFDNGQLHTEADTKIRHLAFAGMANRHDLAFCAPSAKPARNQDRIHAFQQIAALVLDFLGVHVVDFDLAARVNPGMNQSLGQRLVGLSQVNILSDKGDIDALLRMLKRMNQVLPYGEVSRLGQNIELVAHNLVEHLIVQHGGNLVDGIGIERLDHRLALQVAKERDFRFFIFRNVAIGATQQDIGLNADFAQFLYRMLGRLGLQFPRSRDVRNQCEMQVAGVAAPFLQTHLANGLEKRQ